ncbi:MAG TPA: hypothetical protein VJN70_15130 [Gemmatimonadaceae bacterium]|nr:hypothetical protein [Gemmatimonadaceae bacterium]
MVIEAMAVSRDAPRQRTNYYVKSEWHAVKDPLSQFARMLHSTLEVGGIASTHLRRVNLDAVDMLSLIATASWNVNYLVLDGFLTEMGFSSRPKGNRACRIQTEVPVVILINEFRSRTRLDTRAHLVFAECGKYLASAAFLDDAVAFVRSGEIVTYPVTALDDAALASSSLCAVSSRARNSSTEDRLPPGT